jgi:hypothetical protein
MQYYSIRQKYTTQHIAYAAERFQTQKVDCCVNPPYPYHNAEAAILKASAFFNAIFAAEY